VRGGVGLGGGAAWVVAAEAGRAHGGPLHHLAGHGQARTDGPPGARLDRLLVPREDSIELIPAQTDATVVRIRVLPGAKVTPDTILMDLADPQLQQELLNAQLALKAAQADYKSLQATLQSTLMDKKTAAAQVNSDYTQDQLQAQTDKALYDLGVIAGIAYSKSKNTADQLTASTSSASSSSK
jgi:multidrug resistance efflux pump